MLASVLLALQLVVITPSPVFSGDGFVVGYTAVAQADGSVEFDHTLIADTSDEPVPAITPPDVNVDPLVSVRDIIGAAKGQDGKVDWKVLIASVLMLSVWALRNYGWKNIPPAYLKWVVLGITIVMAVAPVLHSGGDWISALISGVGLAFMTAGAWQYVGKPVQKKMAKKDLGFLG